MGKLTTTASLASLLLSMGPILASAQNSPTGVAPATASSPIAPDNTKSNKTDPSNTTQVADAQKNDAADVDLTRRIRQSVTADKNLSTYAHNVKIVSTNGLVTLNGVVRSNEEKAEIGRQASAVAGNNNVRNEIKVAP